MRRIGAPAMAEAGPVGKVNPRWSLARLYFI
jgi:hypothetical protein